MDDDLFTEPADSEPKPSISDFDSMAAGIAEFYNGLVKRGLRKSHAFQLSKYLLYYLLVGDK